MKRFAILALSCALAAPLAAQNIATVNGQAITQQQFDDFVNLLIKQGAEDTPELRDQVKQEMTIRLIAVQEAEKTGLDKKPEVAQELDLARQGILVRALLNEYIQNNKILSIQPTITLHRKLLLKTYRYFQPLILPQ